MRGRGKAGGKAAKTQRRKTLKRRTAPKAAGRRSSLNASDETNVAQLTRERDEALEQLAATGEVLSIIRRSPADAQPVFDAIVQSAARLCDAIFSVVYLRENDHIRIAATQNFTPEATSQVQQRQELKRPDRSYAAGRAILDRAIIHVHDVLADPEYSHELALAGGWRAVLSVPLLRDGKPVGALSVAKAEPMPFSDRQIQLLNTFADQAVIAIENVRLFEAEQARTSELSEALEQQTATSEVLKVISSSPGELEPVFNAMLANATRICEAKFGTLYRYEGKAFYWAAGSGTPAAMIDFQKQRGLFLPPPGTLLHRVLETRKLVQSDDYQAEPALGMSAKLGGARSTVAVPMLKDDELIGAIVIYRQEVRPFTDKQIELVKNFAAQAVIAIENTRLLNELRQRTDALSESLDRQTAMSEVLGVISSSPTDLTPVFDTILANATRLCEGNLAGLWRYDGEFLVGTAQYNASAAFVEHYMGTKLEPGRSGPARLAALECRTVHVADITAEPGFSPMVLQYERARTVLAVPLLREKDLVGVIAIWRREVRPFTEQQIALVRTFADQAVIAIENARLLNELRESLQQQTATADVLKVISSSPGELEPVFQAMLENATRICEAKFGSMALREGDAFRYVAQHNAPPAWLELRRREPLVRPGPGTGMGQIALTKQVYHIADIRTERGYIEGDPVSVAGADLAGYRTLLVVPMTKEDELVGTIQIYRQEVRPFTDKQIELVKNFAAQAVIAIENTRLLNELRESLQQQTATSEVLQVISKSPGELQPVFKAMLTNATDICEAKFGFLWLAESDGFRAVAMHGVPSALAEETHSEGVIRFAPDVPLGRVALTKQLVHVADIRDEPGYAKGFRPIVRLADTGGARTLVVLPMLKDNELIGAIAIYRQEIRPFTDKQIALLTNFAAQAVIAIENTRLLSELRESLQQQTATADVLKVISSSPGELEPVFQAMLENVTKICQAKYGVMFLLENDAFRTRALCGVPPALAEERKRNPVIHPSPKTGVGRVLRTKQTAHIADVLAEPEYVDVPAGFTKPGIVQFGGARTELAVPMLKDDELVGTIVIYRTEVRPFTDKQIELVTNFAAQAVIAIENTRLLNELRTRTNELAQSVSELQALGEVSQAVNSTLDLETVLTTIVGRAVQLSRTDAGAIYVFDERRKEFCLHATYGMSEAMIAAISDQHIGLGDSNIGAATAQRKPIQVPDIRNQPSPVNEIVLREGYRGILIIPLLRPDHIVGALVVRRKTPGEFPQSAIELLQTFADQSVVAIQNARLFESVEARTRDLAKSLEDLRTTQDRLVQTQKLASLGQLTAGIAHEIKNPLNFVNNFSVVSSELIDELRDTVKGLPLDDKARTEINELTDTLRRNLDKVVQHGKRADAIVKNMLLHSREGSGEHRLVDINVLVEEGLNLAYHGARAEKQGFNITLQRSLDPTAGEVDVFPQDITRVLLNLISNGFYAATKRRAETNGGDYEPTLAATTRSLGDRVEITIRDNGTGIPPDVKEKMFNPFFTTKPAGEGTGLGLSISHDIIVKQHGGSIEVDTQPGEFSEFRIILPRAAVFHAESGGRV